MKEEPVHIPDVAASFQKAVVDVLVDHSMAALKEYHINKFAIAGGVASNSAIREAFVQACKKSEIEFYYPSPVYCTDNAAMIAAAGFFAYKEGRRADYHLNAKSSAKLE